VDYERRQAWIKAIADAPNSLEELFQREPDARAFVAELEERLKPLGSRFAFGVDKRFLMLLGEWLARENSPYARALGIRTMDDNAAMLVKVFETTFGDAAKQKPALAFATFLRKRVLLDSSGEPLRQGITATPWAIKPNLVELEELVGTPLPDTAAVITAARGLLAQGLGCVVVSMGGDGALFVTAKECLHAQPPEVAVKSTVGAGDAMVAGFIAGQLRGLSLGDSARLATASALGALTQLGPRLPAAEVIAAFMQNVTLREVALGYAIEPLTQPTATT
jgi:hypothetical protein